MNPIHSKDLNIMDSNESKISKENIIKKVNDDIAEQTEIREQMNTDMEISDSDNDNNIDVLSDLEEQDNDSYLEFESELESIGSVGTIIVQIIRYIKLCFNRCLNWKKKNIKID
jgi:hypothetical protein